MEDGAWECAPIYNQKAMELVRIRRGSSLINHRGGREERLQNNLVGM